MTVVGVAASPHRDILTAMHDQTTTAVFPGTFDPITNGHLDVINRGRKLFDRLVVAVGHNPAKDQLFTGEQRVEIVKTIIEQSDMPNVEVASFPGLTVDFARDIGATAILRGIRNVTDLNYEFQIALTNRAIAQIETVFIMTGDTFAFTSSSLIKQIAAGGGIDRMHRLLPDLVIDKLKALAEKHGGQLPLRRLDHIKEE